MTTQPTIVPAEPAASAPGLTPAAAWSRRVRRVGGFIQAAFAAFWLVRASLAIGGLAGDVLIAASAVAVTTGIAAGVVLLGTAAAGFHDLARLRPAGQARLSAKAR